MHCVTDKPHRIRWRTVDRFAWPLWIVKPAMNPSTDFELALRDRSRKFSRYAIQNCWYRSITVNLDREKKHIVHASFRVDASVVIELEQSRM